MASSSSGLCPIERTRATAPGLGPSETLRFGREANPQAPLIDPSDASRKARLCSLLFFAAFPIVLAAVVIAWLAHPEIQDDRTSLALLLSVPVGPMWVLRGLLMSDADVRREVARRESSLPFGQLQATRFTAPLWILAGVVMIAFAIKGLVALL